MLLNPTVQWLATSCRERAIAEKWLLVEHLRTGQQWKDRLTRSGCWHINLHAKTMPSVVSELAAPWLAQTSLVPIGRTGLELLVDGVVQELLAQNLLTYFRIHTSAHHALSRLLVRTYNDCRLAGLDVTQLPAEALEAPSKAADLCLIFQRVRQQLTATNQVDYADCIAGARQTLCSPQCPLPLELSVLQPEDFPLSRLERELLEALCSRNVAWHTPDSVPPAPVSTTSVASTEANMSQLLAIGEINEVRGAMQHSLTSGDKPTPLDEIELLLSDYPHYVPLVVESLLQWLPEGGEGQSVSIDKLPLTLAEGLPCIYSRPGRLLRSWIRWAESDYMQSRAVQILREGLIKRPAEAEEVGYARLANTLRRVSIGFGLDRYLTQIRSDLDAAKRDAATQSDNEYGYRGDCGSGNLQALLRTIEPFIRLAPPADRSPVAWLEAAQQLMRELARSENVIDRYARAKLLDDIEGMLSILRQQPDALANGRAWLEELPVNSRLLASTPRPGCLHVAPLEQGGASGRSMVYIIGLDDRKFPKRPPIDPILLDAERVRISNHLTTCAQLAFHQQAALHRVLSRLHGVDKAHVVCVRTEQDWSDDSECFASPILNRWSIATEPHSPVSFVAQTIRSTLTPAEQFLRSLLIEPNGEIRQQRLLQRYPRIARERQALAQQRQPKFGAYDGLVPDAGRELLGRATSRPMSPSRLEMLGTCPRKFFFARALGILPPEEYRVDAARWLTALDVGTLLHDVFESFWGELLANDQLLDLTKHGERLSAILEEAIAETAQRIPILNRETFDRQRQELHDYCEIFLHKEQEYLELRDARPWLMEASLGSRAHATGHEPTEIDSDQPIAIELASGRTLLLCGRLDRIDQLGTASRPAWLIWDYKTGSDWGFDPGDAIQAGRKLQPLLYTRMLAKRLEQLGRNPNAVVGFGYFFPTPRTEGRRIEWTTAKLREGEPILEAMLDLLSAGTFIATNNESDCTFCDYQKVCGDSETLVTISNLKREQAENSELAAWRICRP